MTNYSYVQPRIDKNTHTTSRVKIHEAAKPVMQSRLFDRTKSGPAKTKTCVPVYVFAQFLAFEILSEEKGRGEERGGGEREMVRGLELQL